jgi:hypothetical protein
MAEGLVEGWILAASNLDPRAISGRIALIHIKAVEAELDPAILSGIPFGRQRGAPKVDGRGRGGGGPKVALTIGLDGLGPGGVPIVE